MAEMSVARSSRRSRKAIAKALVFYIVSIPVTIAFIGPYALAFLGAFKTQQEIASNLPWALPEHPSLSNFRSLLFGEGFLRSFLVTLAASLLLTVGQVLCSMLGAYAFARLSFRGRDLLFGVYLSTLMVPNVVTMIPLFIMMKYLHLINTFWVLVIPYVFGTAYAVFLMRQFFLSIPEDLIFAAKLDGCGELQTLIRIVVPLSRPILVVASVIAFVFGWNNFLWPLIATSSGELQVLTVALSNFQADANVAPRWNLLFAGVSLTLLPVLIVFVVFQRWIVSSIQLGGVSR